MSAIVEPTFVESLPAAVAESHPERMAGLEGLEARRGDHGIGTFKLIDWTEVCIEVADPLGSGTFGVIVLSDREFAPGIQSGFEAQWTEAEPLEI